MKSFSGKEQRNKAKKVSLRHNSLEKIYLPYIRSNAIATLWSTIPDMLGKKDRELNFAIENASRSDFLGVEKWKRRGKMIKEAEKMLNLNFPLIFRLVSNTD